VPSVLSRDRALMFIDRDEKLVKITMGDVYDEQYNVGYDR